jgi:hypothetical protein
MDGSGLDNASHDDIELHTLSILLFKIGQYHGLRYEYRQLTLHPDITFCAHISLALSLTEQFAKRRKII